jgi:hypothetical protein
MRLVHVAEVHFGKKPPAHYDELMRKRKDLGGLKNDECILLRSKTGNQLVFIWRDLRLPVDGNRNEARLALQWTQLYLRNGIFNPYMIVDYAKQVGLHIDNLYSFEQHLDRLLKHTVKKTFGDRTAARRQKEKK